MRLHEQSYVVTVNPPDEKEYTVMVNALSPDLACATIRKALGKHRGPRTQLQAIRFCTHERRQFVAVKRDQNRQLRVRVYLCTDCNEVIEVIPA